MEKRGKTLKTAAPPVLCTSTTLGKFKLAEIAFLASLARGDDGEICRIIITSTRKIVAGNLEICASFNKAQFRNTYLHGTRFITLIYPHFIAALGLSMLSM